MAEVDGTELGARAAPGPVPQPMAPADAPLSVATSGKAQAYGVAASAVGHLLIGLLIMGSLASAQKPPQIIPVKLVPADQAQQKPPKPQPQQKQAAAPAQKVAPPTEQKSSPTLPPKAAAAAAAAEHPPADAKAPPTKTQTAGPKEATPRKDLTAALGMADFGHETTLPKALLADVITRIKRCWTVPAGWSDPRQVSVTLRFQLNPDGTLDGDPAVVEFPATPIGAAAAKAALTAMKRCAPYQLPAAQYDQWKDIQLSLAP